MYKRILLTGAAGMLGQYLRPHLHKRWPLRSCDVKPVGKPMKGEEVVTCDLSDRAAVFKATRGCDAVLHFGAISIESDFDQILQANIVGTYNVFEGARRARAKRVIHASSNHAVGYHLRDAFIDSDAQPRPDTYYGVSKSFGESLGSMYWSKYGIEHASLRIGTCRAEPIDRRSLSTWLSLPDLLQLVVRCLEAERLGYAIVYGQSNNDRALWDNGKVSHLGFRPQDNAEEYADRLLKNAKPEDPEDPAVKYIGGVFCTKKPPMWKG
ncbi:MAG: NAD(P)-dependent oxidoreductase [Alphaproteobacteria bacterium]|nr:NAD(P)-dependent oxidoreductase [Alphaproteobacteria bacterium]